MHAAAPSFWPLALPAVTVESGSWPRITGLSFASDSRLASGRGCSSRSTSPTATISSAKSPRSCAPTARSCERSASSSCSWRGIPYSRRRFSAVSSIPPGTG